MPGQESICKKAVWGQSWTAEGMHLCFDQCQQLSYKTTAHTPVLLTYMCRKRLGPADSRLHADHSTRVSPHDPCRSRLVTTWRLHCSLCTALGVQWRPKIRWVVGVSKAGCSKMSVFVPSAC